MGVAVGQKVFKVSGKGQGHSAQREQMHFCSGGSHCDSVASRLICLKRRGRQRQGEAFNYGVDRTVGLVTETARGMAVARDAVAIYSDGVF